MFAIPSVSTYYVQATSAVVVVVHLRYCSSLETQRPALYLALNRGGQSPRVYDDVRARLDNAERAISYFAFVRRSARARWKREIASLARKDVETRREEAKGREGKGRKEGRQEGKEEREFNRRSSHKSREMPRFNLSVATVSGSHVRERVTLLDAQLYISRRIRFVFAFHDHHHIALTRESTSFTRNTVDTLGIDTRESLTSSPRFFFTERIALEIQLYSLRAIHPSRERASRGNLRGSYADSVNEMFQSEPDIAASLLFTSLFLFRLSLLIGLFIRRVYTLPAKVMRGA